MGIEKPPEQRMSTPTTCSANVLLVVCYLNNKLINAAQSLSCRSEKELAVTICVTLSKFLLKSQLLFSHTLSRPGYYAYF